ncbi:MULTISPECIES: BrnA antitoxin family protein [unclassified Shimia]|uniref:BrnA antitoxin family protein n=1 Tax=unclassified Shimia TaxID=2630038 RepID=UPI003103E048
MSESTPQFQSRRTGTKTQRMAREALGRNLLMLTSERWVSEAIREAVPEAWHRLEQDLDVQEPKEKVTLYLDQSVARFYRAMGQGYQARINRLLATWAQMKIADELQVERALTTRLEDPP